MAIFYKPFHGVRTALSVAFFMILTVLCAAPQTTNAASALFTVENVSVDVSAGNALKARTQAFEEAQVKAFTELAGRMLSEPELVSFTPPEVLTISTMIQDYEVSDEKISSKRYSGTYKFRFQDRAVKRYFAKSGNEYTDVASRPLLVLPFYQATGQAVLWGYNNPWMRAWASTPNLGSGLVPVVVPIGDLTDVNDIADHEALTYNRRALQAMVQRYNATEAVIAIAKPQDNAALSIEIYRTDKAEPEYVHQVTESGGTQAELMAKGVSSVKQALSRDWKQRTVVKPQQALTNTIQTRVAFNSLQEWTRVQAALARVYGVNDINVKALSPREAYIDISFDGNIDRLKIALGQADLVLSAPRYQQASGGGQYQFGLLGPTQGGTPPAIYDLSLRSAGYSGGSVRGIPSPAPNTQYGGAPAAPRYQNNQPPSQGSYQTQF